MHHPEGMLWIRTPGQEHREVNDPVPLTAIAPTVLRWFGLTPARPHERRLLPAAARAAA